MPKTPFTEERPRKRVAASARVSAFDDCLAQVQTCQRCAEHLPNPPRPVVQAGTSARILVIGQAPGRKVQQTGVPFDDPSGDRLRAWMGVDRTTFYSPHHIALMPMGFCYPGRGRSGDLPPRSECADHWHGRLLGHLDRVELTLLLGRYAQHHYLGQACGKTLTETVKRWQTFWPARLPLPHPSPRNNIWLRRNPWVEGELIPALRQRVQQLLAD
ncbi:MAG TPA: IclR family transcriptional regulator [Gammaproteobacteria bacterium]|nr:IclR family transcriptional regulator [Gammaproteobacteria bacterium]